MKSKHYPWFPSALPYALLVVLASVLVGCVGVSTEATVDFYHGESWRAIIQFVAPTSDAAEVEGHVSRLLSRAERCGAYSSYSMTEGESDLTYTVEIAGNGLECLRQAVFNDQGEITTIWVGDQQQVYLNLPLRPASELESLTITLRGKEILEGDGERIDAQTMTWRSESDQDGWIYAILTEQSGFGLADASVVVDFYAGEKWQATMKFTIPTELLARTMGVDGFEEELQDWIVQAHIHSIYPSWQRTDGIDSLTYTVEVVGNGLESLRQVVFGGQGELVFYGTGDQREIHFSLPVTWMSEFHSLVINLQGGEILRGNGEMTGERAMTWYSLLIEENDWIYAVLTEQSGFSLADASIVIDLYTSDKWQANMELTVPTEVLAQTVGVDAFEGELQEWIAHAYTCGVYPSWHRIDGTDNLTYLVELEGSGLDAISCAIFGWKAQLYAGQADRRRVVNFNQDDGSWWEFDSLELTLRGGEVIESNGWLVDYRTVTWQNPAGTIWAVLTERSRVFGPIRDILAEGGVLAFVVVALAIVIGLLLVAGLVFLSVRLWRRIQSQRPTDCAQCGFHLPEDARYCPECSQKREGMARWLFRRCYKQGETFWRRIPKRWNDLLKSRSSQSADSMPTRSVGGTRLQGGLLERAGGAIHRSLPLPPEGEFILGSDPVSDLCLDDPEVSARHAAICAARTCYFLEDLGSQRGTYLNDELIRSGKRLEDGDVIRLGHTSLVFTTDTLL